MGACTDEQIHALIAQRVQFCKATSGLFEVQETGSSGNLHLNGSNIPSSTQTENYEYAQGQTQGERVFSDKKKVSRKWGSQDNKGSYRRPHHGQDFWEVGRSVAECNEISMCQSNQLQQASQPEAIVTQSPNNVEVAARWPKLNPKNWEEDDTSPGMNELHAYSDVSCETEDSCDYSSGTEDYKVSFTPLSKRFSQEAANPFENQNEDEVAKVQKGHNSACLQRPKELINASKLSANLQNGKQISSEYSIITIDSDSEGEYVTSSETDPEGVEQRGQNHLLTNVIIIDSDTEDDGDQSIEISTTERASSSAGESNTILVMPNQHGRRENETAKHTLTSAYLLQSRSQRQNTQEDVPKDKPEGACYDSLHGAQLKERKDVHDKVENKIACFEAFGRTKNVASRSNSGVDCLESTPSSTKNRENQEIDLQSKKPKISPGNSAKTLPLGLFKPASFSTTGVKKTDVGEKSQLWCSQKKKGEHLSKLKLGNPPKPNVDQNVEQRGSQSKHLSPTTKRDLTCRSVLNSRKNCEAGQSSPSAEGSSRSEEPTSTNCNRKKLKRVTFAPTPHSPFKRLARSTSAPSTSETSATSAFGHQGIFPKDFATSAATKSSPRMKVQQDWKNAHHPIRIERKYHQAAEQNTETTNRTTESINHASNTDSDWPVRPELAQHSEVPRQRRRSQDSNTSLMKRCKNEAKVWSNAIHRQPAQTKRSAVGVGYKWSERPSAAKSTEG